MNSQFRNSNFGFVLYVSIIGLIVAATIFVIWYMTLGYKLGTYGPDTRLGSVYIGGLDSSEVVPKVYDKINYWYNDDTIVFELQYQGYTYSFDRNLLLFNLQVSTYDIVHGVTNELLVYIQPTDRAEIVEEINELPFLQGIIENVDVQALIIDMLEDASLMKSYSCKDIEDYLVDDSLSIVELGSSSFTMPDNMSVDQLLTSINNVYYEGKILINSKELFDMIDTFESELVSSEMSVLSSSMLDIIVDTNFLVNEIHYDNDFVSDHYTIDDYPFFGRNAKVIKLVDESFSFYNPNESDYYFVVEKVSDTEAIVKLYGLPFEYDITVTTYFTELAYITTTTNDSTLFQPGENGAIVEVVREITDIYGEVISTKTVLFEFYPPTIEVTFIP